LQRRRVIVMSRLDSLVDGSMHFRGTVPRACRSLFAISVSAEQ
jgi:hypothetical protein